MNPKIRAALADVETHWPTLALGSGNGATVPRHLETAVDEYCARPDHRDRRGIKSAVVAEIRRTLRHIESAAKRASPDTHGEMSIRAKKLLKTLHHVHDFADVVSLARSFAGDLQRFGKRSARSEPVCPEMSVHLGHTETHGEIYLARVVSVAELMSVGAKLRQCVAHADSTGRKYHQRLRRNAVEFWQLYADGPLALLQVNRAGCERGVIVEAATRDDDPNLPSAVLRRVLVELNASGDDEYFFQERGAFWSLRHSPEPAATVDIGEARHRVWRYPNEIVIRTDACGTSTWSRFRRNPAASGDRHPPPSDADPSAHEIPGRWVQWCWSPDAIHAQDLLDLVFRSRQLYEILAQEPLACRTPPEPDAASASSDDSTHTVEPVRRNPPRQQGELKLTKGMTVDYEIEDGWWCGRMREQPGVFSQGQSREELIEMILDAKQEWDSEQLAGEGSSKSGPY